MRARWHSPWWLVLLCTCAGPASERSRDATAPPAASPLPLGAKPAAEGGAVASAPEASASGPYDGEVYLLYSAGFNAEAVVRIADGEVERLRDIPGVAACRCNVGNDRALYCWGYGTKHAVSRIAGGQVEELPAFGEGLGEPQGVDAAADGTVWYVGEKQTAQLRDGTHSRPVTTPAGVREIDIDGKGRLWLNTADDVQLLSGESWKTTAVPALNHAKFGWLGELAAGHDRVYALMPRGIAEVTDAGTVNFLRLPDGPYQSLSRLAVVHGGDLTVYAQPTGRDLGNGPHHYVRLTPHGASHNLLTFDAPNEPWVGPPAVDDAGRLWIASDAGLLVRVPAGEVVRWPAGTFDALPRAACVFTMGRGPELPRTD